MESFKVAILAGDVAEIDRNAAEVCNIFDSISRETKWLFLKQKSIEYQIDKEITLSPMFTSLEQLYVPYDASSKHLRSWKYSAIPEDERIQFDNLYHDMNRINGFMKPWTVIMMFGYMFGRKFFDHQITRIMVHYLDMFNSEPFVEKTDGTIVLSEHCDDVAVTLRLKLYIRVMWEVMTKKIPDEEATESFYFFFKDPQYNTDLMKKMKAPLINAAFSMSSSGHTVGWTSFDLNNFVLKPVSKMNPDKFTYARLKKDIDESREKFYECGLYKTFSMFFSLIHAPINERNVGLFSTYWFWEAMTGFMRSNFPNTALKDIETSQGRRIFRPDNLIKDKFYDLWYECLSGYVGSIPKTQEEYVIDLMADLTTRSNGLNDFIKDDDGTEKMNPDVVSQIINISTNPNRKKMVAWKFKDKASTTRLLLRDPKELFNYYKMIRSLSEFDPGRAFTRVVPARDIRFVYGIPIYRFYTERFTNYAYHFLADKRFPSPLSGKPGFPISTLAIDTGRYLTEMGRYLFYTGNPDEHRYILLADFGSFDQTQVFENFRAVQIKALKQVMIDNATTLENLRYEIFGGKHLLEYLLANWETYSQARFRIYTGRVINGKPEYQLPLTGWLYSGENPTLVQNTMTNKAYTDTVIEMMDITYVKLADRDYALSEYFRFDMYKLQGDDQIAILNVISNFSEPETELFHDAFMKLLLKVAESAGLDISINKTGLRALHFEFLKKAGLGGYAVPRYLQISLEEQETVNRTLDPIERMRSRLGQVREYMFRGGSTVFGLMRLYFEWNLIRKVIFGRNTMGERVADLLPFSFLWTPVSKGGVGMHPTVNTDPNVDVILSLYPWPPNIRESINRNIMAVEKAPRKDNTFILKQVSPILEPGMKILKTYDAKANSETILNAMKSLKWLTENTNLKEDKNAYHLRYEQELIESIEDSPQMSSINKEWKISRCASIIIYIKSVKVQPYDYLNDMFIPGVTFEYAEELTDGNLPCNPIAGLDDYLGNWIRQIGTSSESKVASGDEFSNLARLINTGNFPRNLKANNIESIAGSLLKHKLFTREEIMHFLVMRGAPIESATSVAEILAKKLDSLKTLSEVSAYSLVGEGFTNKSKERIDSVVKFPDLRIDFNHPFSDLIRSIGYQYMRTDSLWNYKGNKLEINKRRNVIIHITNETIISYLTQGLINETVENKQVRNEYETALRNTMFSTF